MILNMREISKNLTKVVTELIGYRLAKVRGQGGIEIPAVILERTAIDKPERPFAMVDYGSVTPVGQGARNIYLDDNKDEVVVKESTGTFTISIVGGEDDDPVGILEELTSRLYSSKGCREFSCAMGDSVEILDILQIVSTPTPLKTGYQETARVILYLSMVSSIVDTTVGTIENIELDGYSFDDFNQQKFPSKTETNVP